MTDKVLNAIYSLKKREELRMENDGVIIRIRNEGWGYAVSVDNPRGIWSPTVFVKGFFADSKMEAIHLSPELDERGVPVKTIGVIRTGDARILGVKGYGE